MRSILLFCLLCLPCAAQSNYWVDPVSGLDQAAGTSPSTPLRTITRALELAVPGTNVFLSPGEYSPTSGETLPLEVGVGVSIRSLEGAAATTLTQGIQGGIQSDFLLMDSGSSLVGVTIASHDGHSLRTTSVPLQTQAIVSQCHFVGGAQAIGSSDLRVESSRFEGQLTAAVFAFVARMTFVDCDFVGTPSASGILAVTNGFGGFTSLIEVSRCKFQGYGLNGIRLRIDGSSPLAQGLIVRDSLITGNGRDGIQFHTPSPQGVLSYNAVIEGTTIAGNGRHGVFHSFQSVTPGLSLRSCIVANNGNADFRGAGSIDYCLVGDGSGPVGTGNITGDPGFVDAAADDWSLRFDSPCLDRGDPSVVRADLLGHPRTVDSDLDLSPRSDIGALEHRPLTGPSTATVGQPFELGVTGPLGGFSTIVIAPGGYAPTGANTIFGRLFLEPQGSFRATPAPTTGGGPTYVDLAAILDPAWIGTTIGFQALPRSFAAPAGGAFSNPLLVMID